MNRYSRITINILLLFYSFYISWQTMNISAEPVLQTVIKQLIIFSYFGGFVYALLDYVVKIFQSRNGNKKEYFVTNDMIIFVFSVFVSATFLFLKAYSYIYQEVIPPMAIFGVMLFYLIFNMVIVKNTMTVIFLKK